MAQQLRNRRVKHRSNSHRQRALRMESLEQRTVLASYVWTGAVDTAWDNAGNWTSSDGGASFPQAAADTAQINDVANDPVLSNARTVGGLSGNGVLTLSETLTINIATAATTFDFSGTLSGSGGLLKQGAGTQTLSGTTPNTYNGTTIINGGLLQLNKSAGTNAIGNAGFTVQTTANVGGVVRLLADHQIPDSAPIVLNANVTDGNARFDLAGKNETVGPITMRTVTGGGTPKGATITTGTGTLTLNADITLNHDRNATGNLADNILISGNLNLNGTRTITVNSTATGVMLLGANAQISALISNGKIIKAGTRDLVLSNAGNTFSGGIDINSGRVIFTAGGALGPTSVINVAAGATLTYAGTAAATIAHTINLPTNAILGARSGTLTVTNPVLPSSGTIKFNDDEVANTGTVIVKPAIAITGDLTIQVGNLTGTPTGGTAQFDGAISGNFNVTKSGVGVASFTTANSYTGNTIVIGGTLAISADNQLGVTPGSPTAGRIVLNGGSLGSNASYVLNSNRGIALGPATGTGTGSFNISAGHTVSYSGTIANNAAGTGNLEIIGPGIVVLDTANTYTGTTIISDGILRIRTVDALGPGSSVSAIGGGTLELDNLATPLTEPLFLTGAGAGDAGALSNFDGNNTVSGSITMLSGGTIGSAQDKLTISGLVNQGALGAITFTGAGSIDVLSSIAGNFTANRYLQRLWDIDTLDPQSETEVESLLGTTSQFTEVENRYIHFFDDAAFTAESGFNVDGTGDDHSYVVMTRWTPDVPGLWEFRYANADDHAAIWIDKDDDGDFETGASAARGTERIANSTSSNQGVRTGSFIVLPSDIAEGRSFILMFAMRDTGGNGYLQDVEVRGPTGSAANDAGAFINFDLTLPALDGLFNYSDGGIIKNGAGQVLLAGANTYYGLTTVNAGTLVVGHDNALGQIDGGTWVADGATLGFSSEINGDLEVASEPITVEPAAILKNISGVNRFAGNVTLLGQPVAQPGRYAALDIGPTTQRVESTFTKVGTAADLVNATNLAATPLTSDTGDAYSVTIDNVNRAGTATGGIDWRDRGDDGTPETLSRVGEDFVKNGGGIIRVTLTGLPDGWYEITSYHIDSSNTQSDQIQVWVNNGDGNGYINTGAVGTAGAQLNNSANNLTQAIVNASRAVFMVLISGGNPVQIVFDGTPSADDETPLNGLVIVPAALQASVTLDAAANSALIHDGAIMGVSNATVTKTGAGAYVANGANTFPGVVDVAAGALFGNGSFVADVHVRNQAIISPGAGLDQAGTLTVGDLTIDAGGIGLSDLTTSGIDRLVVNGDVLLASGAVGDARIIGGFTPQSGVAYELLDNRGPNPIVGEFAGLPQNANGYLFEFSTGVPARLYYNYDADTNTLLTGNDIALIFENRAPVNTAPATVSTNEDEPLAFTGPALITVSDADANGNPVRTDISVPAGQGLLSVTAQGGAIVTSNGSPAVRIEGNVSAVNATLATLIFTPATNLNGNVVLTVLTNDLGNTGPGGEKTDTDTIIISVAPINDAPSFALAGTPPNTVQNAGPQTVANFASSMSPGPANESGQTLNFIATVTGTTGNLSFSSSPAIDPTTGTLTYTVTPGTFGTATVSVVLQDNGPAGPPPNQNMSAAQTFTITVVANNMAPTNQVPATVTMDEDTTFAFTGANAVSIGDPDAGSAPVRTTVSGTGVLSVTPAAGATVTGNGSASVQIVGPVSAINATLASLAFTPDANANGPVTLTVTTDDQGNTGPGGAQTDSDPIVVNVQPVNDAPTFSLAGDVDLDFNPAPQVLPGFATGMSPGPANESGQALLPFEVTVTGTTGTLAFTSAPAIDATGKLTFTVASGTFGDATVAVTLRDDGSNILPNRNSATQSFTIRVADVQTVLVDMQVAGESVLPTTSVNVVPGVPVTLEFTVTDANSGFTVDWGDGRPETSPEILDSTTILFTYSYSTYSSAAGFQPLLLDSNGDVVLGAGEIPFVVSSPIASIGETLYVGGTNSSDRIVVQPGSGGVRVRMNNVPLPAHSVGDRIVVFGNAGNDTITVSNINVNVEFHGGAGDDYLAGGAANDILNGGAGSDRLLGGGGSDTLYGGPGNDALSGGVGNDTLFGDSYLDVYGDTQLPPASQQGRDRISGDIGNDVAYGEGDNDTINGGLGSDLLRGGNGIDTLSGDDGNDVLAGDADSDRMYGRAGNDVLIGGASMDTIYGGSGEDLMYGNLLGNDVDQQLQDILALWSAGQQQAAVDKLIDESTPATDGIVDVLYGEGGSDWYLLYFGDKIAGSSEKAPANTIQPIL